MTKESRPQFSLKFTKYDQDIQEALAAQRNQQAFVKAAIRAYLGEPNPWSVQLLEFERILDRKLGSLSNSVATIKIAEGDTIDDDFKAMVLKSTRPGKKA